MNMWQPIETAPKDGSFILLATPKGRIADGFWALTYGVWSWPYVMIEPTHWMPLPEAPGAQAQPAKNAVAYLDLGTGGYMDVGTDLTDEELATLPKGRHMLGIIGTYGVDGYVPAQPAPSVPDGSAVQTAARIMYVDLIRQRDALRAENAALIDDMNLLRNNNTALRSKIEAAENDAAHQKALAASALRVAEGWERKCGELRAKIERIDEAMESLLIRCDDSDSAMYGTLSTSFVRDTVRIARGAMEESK